MTMRNQSGGIATRNSPNGNISESSQEEPNPLDGRLNMGAARARAAEQRLFYAGAEQDLMFNAVRVFYVDIRVF